MPALIFNPKDLNPMSFEEFGSHLLKLQEQIIHYQESTRIRFDAIAPILRSGGITGGMLGVSLRISNVIPLQFKCDTTGVLNQKLKFPKLCLKLPSSSNILICENNTSSGRTARAAIELLRLHQPDAKLYYATLTKVFGGPDEFEGVEKYFYAIMTNERNKADSKLAQSLKLRSGITLFPWEHSEDELKELNLIN